MRIDEAFQLVEAIGAELDGVRGGSGFAAHTSLSPAFAPKAGIGVGPGRGENDVRLAIRAWTEEDLVLVRDVIEQEFAVSRSEIDALVTGEIHAAHPSLPPGAPATAHLRTRGRKIQPGVSIGHVRVTAGTLGAFVEIGSGGRSERRMLSNNHIFANALSVAAPRAAARGDMILHPAPGDRGVPPPAGFLDTWVDLKPRGNVVDAALARCDPAVDWDPSIPGIGPVTGVFSGIPPIGLPVEKVGRTTGHTRGTVRASNVFALPIRYGPNIFRFQRVIEIAGNAGQPFSQPGDSGALILDGSGNAVALLFAGTTLATYANPFSDVQLALGISRIL